MKSRLLNKDLAIWALLFVLFFPTNSQCIEAEPFSPYIESHKTGWIDWDNGYIYGVGKGYLDLNNASRTQALGAARVIASGNIVKLAAGLRLDDRNTLQSLGKGRVVIRLKAFLRYEEVETVFKSGESPHYEVTYRTPLNGLKGLTSTLLDQLESTSSEWSDFPKNNTSLNLNDEDQPWLVLDARQLADGDKPVPAIFPKIISEKGEAIYELKKVHQAAVTQRGMASYVVSEQSGHQIESKNDAMENILARIQELLSVNEAFAEEKEKRSKRRKFIVKDIKSAQGLAKTNLVISEKDAQQLKKEDASSKILERCRVIVIVSSPIGGIEAYMPRLLARAVITQ